METGNLEGICDTEQEEATETADEANTVEKTGAVQEDENKDIKVNSEDINSTLNKV